MRVGWKEPLRQIEDTHSAQGGSLALPSNLDLTGRAKQLVLPTLSLAFSHDFRPRLVERPNKQGACFC